MLKVNMVVACTTDSAGMFHRLLEPVKYLDGKVVLHPDGLRVGFALWNDASTTADVIDIDDYVWDSFRAIAPGFDELVRDVPVVTVCGDELALEIRARGRTGPIIVCKSGVTEELYPRLPEPEEPVVLWRGGRGWLRAAETLPARVVRWGRVPGATIPHCGPFGKYVAALRRTQRTLEIIPSFDGRLERCKSAIKLYQAMAQGVACIVSHLPPYGPEVVDGDTAVVYHDPSEIDAKIDWLLADASTRRRIAARGREWVLTERNSRVLAGAFLDAWELAAKGRDDVHIR